MEVSWHLQNIYLVLIITCNFDH